MAAQASAGATVSPLTSGVSLRARRALDEARIAVVHDYLSQRGGAERVVLAMMRAFPNARLITSVYEPRSTFPEFAEFNVETTALNRVSAFRRDPRRALPFLASAFGRHVVSGVDLVICSSTGWAHGINAPGAQKLVYCHSPARWLYESDDYFAGLPAPVVRAVRAALRPLHRWDVRAAASVDRYLVNSTTVQRRVMRAYGRPGNIVYPPMSLCPGTGEPVPGIEPGFLLTVSRRRGYKHVDAICEAVEELPDERLVVIGGLPERKEPWSDRIVGLTDLNDRQLRWMYANCEALIAISNEDFGLTPVEAYASGRPAIVLRRGGYLDSTVEGVTGIFVDEPTREAVKGAVMKLRKTEFDPAVIARHATQFSEEEFTSRLQAEARQLLSTAATSGTGTNGRSPVAVGPGHHAVAS